jgi:uncharacterized protein YyaL (SSP411 family)
VPRGDDHPHAALAEDAFHTVFPGDDVPDADDPHQRERISTKPIALGARTLRGMKRTATALAMWALVACGGASSNVVAPKSASTSSASSASSVDVAAARKLGRTQGFEWMQYDAAAFDKAKKERRFILLDGAAEWCHWCHVMDATTYRDPDVGKILKEKFVAIRIDVDARPDLEERYADWGWPATILLSPDAEEIGKFRGYLPPDRMLAALEAITTQGSTNAKPAKDLEDAPASIDALPWVASRTLLDLDDWFDDVEGGWGKRQKAPIGANVEIEVARALHGDANAKARVVLTLTNQHALVDPVWGGVYQYSAGSDWTSPHFEKLMTVQAAAIEAYARAYVLTKDASILADGNGVVKYVTTFLSAPDGGFYTNQDADVGAHDEKAAFVDGHDYYAKDDAGRRALGMPWIDTHVYGRETGIAVAALCTMFEATHDDAVLTRAKKAGDALLAGHLTPGGGVWHGAQKKDGPRFLADSAAVARAFARLAEVTGDAKYLDAAKKVVEAMTTDFADATSAALFDATIDSDAAGVFARRTHPFVHEVVAARSLAALGRVTKDATYVARAKKLLAAISTPKSIDAQGRWLGEFLVALDEVGAVAW